MTNLLATNEGITLIGEAAQAYVRYKYFATIFDGIATVALIIVMCCFMYKLLKDF